MFWVNLFLKELYKPKTSNVGLFIVDFDFNKFQKQFYPIMCCLASVQIRVTADNFTRGDVIHLSKLKARKERKLSGIMAPGF